MHIKEVAEKMNTTPRTIRFYIAWPWNSKKDGFNFNVHQDYDEALKKIVNTIQLNAGDKCLDIGIGTGNLGSRFLDKGIKVIGVDQSGKMLEACVCE